ncbi:hypothetical protein AX17_005414 [Amanita inopinata Kibby_2008]|nr:hypothetical protein AX17_005414 [Amanita inopinata Kibby_2008]
MVMLADLNDEAHTTSIKLQRHSLDASRAHDRLSLLERENDVLRKEIATLRAYPHPDTSSDSHPAVSQVRQLTLSLRQLSDKLSFTEKALLERSTELADASSKAKKAKYAAESAYELAARVRGREEAGKEKERELQRKVRAAEEQLKMSDLVVKEYADLVRSLEGKLASRSQETHKRNSTFTTEVSEGSTSNVTAAGRPSLAESIEEGKLGLQRLISEFAEESERLQEEVGRLQNELAIAVARADAQEKTNQHDRVELAKTQTELQKLKLDDSTATKMVSRYMKFSQTSTDTLQKAIDSLKVRHAATIDTLSAQISFLTSQLQDSEAASERLRTVLDEMGGDYMKESYGRRREVGLRIKLINREEILMESLRRWLLRAQESLSRDLEVSDQGKLEKMVNEAKGLLFNDEWSSEPSSGSVARIIAAQTAADSLIKELQTETARRLELTKSLYLNLDDQPNVEANGDLYYENGTQYEASLSDVAVQVTILQDSSLVSFPDDALKVPTATPLVLGKTNVIISGGTELAPVAVPNYNDLDSDKQPQTLPIPDHLESSLEDPCDDGSVIGAIVGSVEPIARSVSTPVNAVPSVENKPEGLTKTDCTQPAVHPQQNGERELDAVNTEARPDLLGNHVETVITVPSHDRHDTQISTHDPSAPVEEIKAPPNVALDSADGVLQQAVIRGRDGGSTAVSVDPVQEPRLETKAPEIIVVHNDELGIVSLSADDQSEVFYEFSDGLDDLDITVAVEPSSLISEASSQDERISVTDSPVVSIPEALTPLKHPLLAELDSVYHRYDGLQRNFHDCHFALDALKESLAMPSSPGFDLSNSMNHHIPPDALKMALGRLSDYIEDARVELEIRIADESLLAHGYETLLSVPGALASPVSSYARAGPSTVHNEEVRELTPMRSEIESEIEAFVSGTEPSVQKARENLTHKLADIQHDITVLKRVIYDQEELAASMPSTASTPLSPPATAPATSNQNGGWTSWIRGPASRPTSPAPTFGNVMTTPKLRHSPSLNLPTTTSASRAQKPYFQNGHADAGRDPLAKLGLKVSMPMYVLPQSPVYSIPRSRTVSTMYMVGLGARTTSGSLTSLLSPKQPVVESKREVADDEGLSDVE